MPRTGKVKGIYDAWGLSEWPKRYWSDPEAADDQETPSERSARGGVDWCGHVRRVWGIGKYDIPAIIDGRFSWPDEGPLVQADRSRSLTDWRKTTQMAA